MWFLIYRCDDYEFNKNIAFGCKGLGERTHHFTLLDGEMIIDTLPDSQKQERRYLIYDLMAINQVSVIEVGFALTSSNLFILDILLIFILHVLAIFFGVISFKELLGDGLYSNYMFSRVGFL